MRRYARARPTQPRTGMNKLEAAYGAHLDLRERAGEVLHFAFEPIKFRLADRTYYTPDYLVVAADCTVEIHEVKGFWEDDARVKIKVAAEMNPYFRFVAVAKQRGVWTFEEF